MDPVEQNSLARRLLDLGLAPEKVARIQHALDAGDGRTFLHELLLRGLWDDVVDEHWPQPQWIEQWRTLGANGFPLINAAALERLLRAGVDVHDLTDVVRSAQVLAIYNIAQLLDHPTQVLGWDLPESAGVHLGCAVGEAGDGVPQPYHRPHALHPELLARDPSGRQGEPRTLEWRQFHALPAEAQTQIRSLLQAGQMSQAAALWKKHVGGELRHCLGTVQGLAGQLGASHDATP